MIPKLLIIEDDPGIPSLLEYWIGQHAKGKIELLKTNNLSAGKVLAPQAGVIILDLGLPDSKSPEETLPHIKELSKHAPVVVLTGMEDPVPPYDQPLLGQAVEHFGADSCLFKSMVLKEGMSGIDLLMFFVLSAAYRRADQNKSYGPK